MYVYTYTRHDAQVKHKPTIHISSREISNFNVSKHLQKN